MMQQALNPVDVAMLCVDRELRSIGSSGFQTQLFLWLDGRADAQRLQSAIAQVSRRHPVLAARIVDNGGAVRPYWQLRADAECPLHELVLPSNDRQAVLDAAGRLLSVPNDPVVSDPIGFHLLHRPGGSDVFLMQFNHTLMDGAGSQLLVREINRLASGGLDEPAAPVTGPANLLHRYLKRFPRERKRISAQHATAVHGDRLRGRGVMLSAAAENVIHSQGLRIATRALSPEQTRAVEQRGIATSGMPGLSMVLLASVFRAIDRLTPERRPDARYFSAGIGIDLGLRRNGRPLLGNWMSVVPVWAGQDEVGDRDGLVRRLNERLRENLAGDVDLGVLSLTNVFHRKPRHIGWAVWHLLRYRYSLWYAFFGSLDGLGERFCGAAIDEAFYAGPAWSPMGITLLANQHHGRLLIQATYVPEIAPPELVQQYLDQIVTDVVG
jgi:hypothetical protein